jgi:carbon monoxide dehydrogenase subunit G
MTTYTAAHTIEAEPDAVLEALTDPRAIARWSPVGFEVDGLRAERLHRGATARVSGRLAGCAVDFDVEVQEASQDRLALTAFGPIDLDVTYHLQPAGRATRVQAAVSVARGRGLVGLALARATQAMLAAGVLHSAVGRIADEVEEVALAAEAGLPLAAAA